MIVRHTDNVIYDDNAAFENGQRFKKWTFNHIPPHTKGGMKDVYDLLKEADLEKYYKLIVHINTPIDCNMNDEEEKDSQNNNNDDDVQQYEYQKYKDKKKNKWKNGKNQNVDKDEDKVLNYLSKHKNGVLLNVNVKPNAKESCILESDDQCLYLRIAAQPTDGAANKELCRFIAKIVGCGKSDVQMHRGHKSRDKCVLIQNVSLKDVSNKIMNEL